MIWTDLPTNFNVLSVVHFCGKRGSKAVSLHHWCISVCSIAVTHCSSPVMLLSSPDVCSFSRGEKKLVWIRRAQSAEITSSPLQSLSFKSKTLKNVFFSDEQKIKSAIGVRKMVWAIILINRKNSIVSRTNFPKLRLFSKW